MATTQTNANNQNSEKTKITKVRKTEKCGDLRKGIKFYRAKTWGHQDVLGMNRSTTYYPEKKPGRCLYLKYVANRWKDSAQKHLKIVERLSEPKYAICSVFGRYCQQAIAVTWCESRHSVNASNGQYQGLFQMGYSERLRFGHGPTAIEQARAAWRYFRLTGYDWSPWSCKPWHS